MHDQQANKRKNKIIKRKLILKRQEKGEKKNVEHIRQVEKK